MTEKPYERAVIVYANYFRFAPGEIIHNGPVKSRMLLWCKAGCGEVTVNRDRFALRTGSFIMIPWNHDIRYEADRRRPFHVGGIHIVPWHAPDTPVSYAVPHRRDHPLAKSPYRKDTPVPSLDTIRTGSFSLAPALEHLAEYGVLYFRQSPEEPILRALAVMIIDAVIAAVESGNTSNERRPPYLQKLIRYVYDNMDKPVSLSDLALHADMSPSAVGRLFRRRLGMTPVQWIRKVKMDRARELLRTTRLSVTAIGRQSGYGDIFYFSAQFRRHSGLSPLQYRRKELTI